VVRHAKVTAEARVKTPANAERVLAEGRADLVSIVRGQIADPHLANKAMAGNPDDIRPCISCNQLCIGRRMRDYWISCLVNPSAGREHEWDGDAVPAAERPRDVLVIGGGPAGLEAARVAALRGHRVRLVEKPANSAASSALPPASPNAVRSVRSSTGIRASSKSSRCGWSCAPR
jgi:NADPH-dependent 2,4-dienoyl-CoA reductase/sulfur reductase-like enzyme